MQTRDGNDYHNEMVNIQLQERGDQVLPDPDTEREYDVIPPLTYNPGKVQDSTNIQEVSNE